VVGKNLRNGRQGGWHGPTLLDRTARAGHPGRGPTTRWSPPRPAGLAEPQRQQVEVLRGVDCGCAAARSSAWSASPGPAKSVLSLAMLVCCPRRAAAADRPLRVTGTDMHNGDAEAHRTNRRDHLGAFPGPMTSLNPPCGSAGRGRAAGGVAEAVRCWTWSGVPDARRRMRQLPARALRRPATAGDDPMAVAATPSW